MPRNESIRALHAPVGNVPDDLRHLMGREIDPDDGSCLCDVDMRRRVIERVDPYLESFFTNDRRHIIPNALGCINSLVCSFKCIWRTYVTIMWRARNIAAA